MKKQTSPILIFYLLKLFLPVFFIALLFFVLILQLGDLFYNLVQYMENHIPLTEMLKVMVLFLPKCISYSVPLSILFAGGYTFGNLYAKNELTAIFSSGISIHAFAYPVIILAFLLSIVMFFFEDKVVISTFSQKNKTLSSLANKEQDLSLANVALMSELGKVVYYANQYNDIDKKLLNLKVIIRNEGNIEKIIYAQYAVWNEETSQWDLSNTEGYNIDEQNEITYMTDFTDVVLTEPPSSFQRDIVNVEEMKIKEAKEYIDKLKKAGLPHNQHLVKYYQRFSYPLAIFIVLLLSIAFGGYFKINVLIMSLITSLLFAVVYYVAQMLAVVFATWGILSPIVGAWLPFIMFFGLSVFLLKRAKT